MPDFDDDDDLLDGLEPDDLDELAAKLDATAMRRFVAAEVADLRDELLTAVAEVRAELLDGSRGEVVDDDHDYDDGDDDPPSRPRVLRFVVNGSTFPADDDHDTGLAAEVEALRTEVELLRGQRRRRPPVDREAAAARAAHARRHQKIGCGAGRIKLDTWIARHPGRRPTCDDFASLADWHAHRDRLKD